MQKPFKTYFGGKEAPGVYQTIINHIRPHHYFAEPFGGNFTISRKINSDAIKYINDIDKQVYKRYEHINERIRFSNLDYQNFVNEFLCYSCELNFKSVIYFDPPYPLFSRKSSKKVYKHEFELSDHIEFLNFAISKNAFCDILISTYPNELYKESLKDWYLVEFDGCDRHGKTTEWLFMNYNPKEITQLHDARYYGDNFTDRQRISRSVNNTVRKILNHENPIIKHEIIRQIQNSL
jgi:DNA adenine methylase